MSNLVPNTAPPVPAEANEERAVTVGPRVDILETEHEFVVLADMPGVKPGDVDIRFEKGELSVHGRRAAARGYARTNYQRVFTVADTVAADKIAAELKNGVLTIKLPKTEAVKPRRIAVSG